MSNSEKILSIHLSNKSWRISTVQDFSDRKIEYQFCPRRKDAPSAGVFYDAEIYVPMLPVSVLPRISATSPPPRRTPARKTDSCSRRSRRALTSSSVSYSSLCSGVKVPSSASSARTTSRVSSGERSPSHSHCCHSQWIQSLMAGTLRTASPRSPPGCSPRIPTELRPLRCIRRPLPEPAAHGPSRRREDTSSAAKTGPDPVGCHRIAPRSAARRCRSPGSVPGRWVPSPSSPGGPPGPLPG